MGTTPLRFYSIRRFVLSGCCILLTISLSLADDSATIETIAGTGESGVVPVTGRAVEVPIGNPFGVELGPDGALYICEVDHHRVRRLDLETGQLTTFAGTGRKGYAGDGGPATTALLNEPYEVRFDTNGNMYFVEMQNHLVRRVDRQTGIISTVAGCGEEGYGGDGGPALEAKMKRPHSIGLDEQGKLYIADIGNHRIRVVDLKTGTINSLAGNGAKSLPVDGDVVRGKPMLGPRALTVEGRTLWIALREGHSVWKLDLDSEVIQHVAGTGKKGFSGDGGPALQATFNGPKGIAVGPKGNIFVVDTENQVIRNIDRETGTLTTVAGRGPKWRGPEGDRGPATSASMNRPHGICVGPDGTIYIGDSENHRVRRVR
ncbi:Serine/threonine-protein kinase PknD [Polystyrenella longa]|uniref:Serine/threonine-protein kinase PknD n=1 Tax=Polystyrenella longa TaxID=2528007 RepID=A0A518CMC3_9PLAN|nr:hypothetical protein [Polystyrenella longa]QDU80379.1 Serine/threonine-protein kinase PknD [Polystyrenella longa]